MHQSPKKSTSCIYKWLFTVWPQERTVDSWITSPQSQKKRRDFPHESVTDLARGPWEFSVSRFFIYLFFLLFCKHRGKYSCGFYNNVTRLLVAYWSFQREKDLKQDMTTCKTWTETKVFWNYTSVKTGNSSGIISLLFHSYQKHFHCLHIPA